MIATRIAACALLALVSVSGCGGGDDEGSGAAADSAGSTALAPNADSAPAADAGSSSTSGSGDEATCKKALLIQARRNFELALESQGTSPDIDRNIPKACEFVKDPATQRRLAKEVAAELAKEKGAGG
ncbi:MAG: hypothetical protein ACT4PP_12400 [Sporichthyaceae bacterium]